MSRDQALVALLIGLGSFALALVLMALLWTLGLRLLDRISHRYASFELVVAVRQLRGRKSGYLKLMTVVVLLAMTMANWALPTVLSVMGGFGNDLKQKILDATAHILVDAARPDLSLPVDPQPADFDRLAREMDEFPDTELVLMAPRREDADRVATELQQRGVDPQRMTVQRSPNASRAGVRLTVSGNDRALRNADELARRIAQAPGVVGVTPFIEADVMLASQTNISSVVLKGIDLDTMDRVIGLRDTIELGKLEYLRQPEKILPEVLAEQERRLQLLLADAGLDTPLGDTELPSSPPEPSPEAGPDQSHGTSDAGSEPEANLDLDAGLVPRFMRGSRPVASPPAEQQASGEVLPAVIIGRELAKTLRAFVGDEINVVSPLGGLGPLGPIPKARPFRVGGVFYSGMYQDDAKNAYVPLEVAQHFLGMEGRVNGLRVRVRDIEKAATIAAQLRQQLGSGYRVRSWEEVNANLFSALRLEKIAMFALFTVFFVICAFLIASTLTMMVLEKRRGIAVLKTLGASDLQLGAVFMLQGVLAGTVGAISGQIAAFILCLALGRFVEIQPEVYYIDRLPVAMEPAEFATVAALALITAMVSTVLPLAATVILRPVEGLKQ